MEAVIFNSDFEWQLFQARQEVKSSRKTQEFEYLINWISSYETIFTSKDYSKAYKRWFFKFNQTEFKYTDQAEKINLWSGNYQQIDLKRKLQDKSRTLHFAAKYDLGPQEFSFITQGDQIEPGFLYKYPKSLSGMGHYTFEDKDKIEKQLQSGETLTKEKVLKRLMDFSSLWMNNELLFFYQNLINENFQYRGTIIRRDQDLLTSEQKRLFESKLALIKGWLEDYHGILSIDSFIYEEAGEENIYFLSEINCRKTMGYVANKLADKFFPSKKIVKFMFGNYKIKLDDYEKLWKDSHEAILPLSPEGNKFKCFLIGCDDEALLPSLEKLIF